jgi:hypothetical protein
VRYEADAGELRFEPPAVGSVRQLDVHVLDDPYLGRSSGPARASFGRRYLVSPSVTLPPSLSASLDIEVIQPSICCFACSALTLRASTEPEKAMRRPSWPVPFAGPDAWGTTGRVTAFAVSTETRGSGPPSTPAMTTATRRNAALTAILVVFTGALPGLKKTERSVYAQKKCYAFNSLFT